ncbi:flagellar basal body L-ring protein FlgH [Deltaproteobacteria bacterium TL4]
MANKIWSGVLIFFVLMGSGGCSTIFPKKTVSPENTTVEAQTPLPSSPKRDRRPQIPIARNRYEGSLWRDEASFGNLWRDHRARFRHDLLTIVELASVISVPPPKPLAAEATKPKSDLEKANVVLEALTLRDSIEEEQNSILRSIETISAEVIRVLPNGNMLVRGRKIDHRQQNKVRYVTIVTGVLRPADVNDTNVVSAAKLVNPEVQIKRQVQGSLLRERLDKLGPLIGKQKAGVLGRITDFTKADAKSKGGKK